MPLESQNEQSQKSGKSLPEQYTLSKVDDSYVERAIAEAMQQSNTFEEPEQVLITITESQEKMAGELRKALGLAFGVTLNSAAKYALFYAKYHGLRIEELAEYPNSPASHSLKLKVTPETWHKLRESNAIDQLSECIATGIQLLYKQLINVEMKV